MTVGFKWVYIKNPPFDGADFMMLIFI